MQRARRVAAAADSRSLRSCAHRLSTTRRLKNRRMIASFSFQFIVQQLPVIFVSKYRRRQFRFAAADFLCPFYVFALTAKWRRRQWRRRAASRRNAYRRLSRAIRDRRDAQSRLAHARARLSKCPTTRRCQIPSQLENLHLHAFDHNKSIIATHHSERAPALSSRLSPKFVLKYACEAATRDFLFTHLAKMRKDARLAAACARRKRNNRLSTAIVCC